MQRSSSLRSVAQPLLRDRVHAEIERAIITGALAPGQVVRDVDLAAQLGVSRTPVREAILRLISTGLVHARPGHSTVVAPLDAEHLAHARDVIASMHALATRAAVPLFTDAHFDAMDQAAAAFERAVQERDIEATFAADEAFHGVAVAVSGNPIVRDVISTYSPVLRRLEWMRFSTEDSSTSLAEHEAYLFLCRARDVEAAAECAHRTWATLDLSNIPDVPPATDTRTGETPTDL